MILKFIAVHGGTLPSALRYLSRRVFHSDYARKVGETYTARIILVLLGLVSSVIVARTLGPQGRGLYSVALTLGAIGMQFANFGLHISNTYYVSKDRRLLPALLGNSLWIGLGFGGSGALAAWIVFETWPFLAPLKDPLLSLALVGVPLGLTYMFLQNLLLGIQEIRTYNKIEVAIKAFSVGLMFLILFSGKMSVEKVFMAGLISSAVGLGWVFVSLRRGLRGLLGFSMGLFRKTFDYGLKAYINVFFAYLVLKVDLLMVQYIQGAEQAGYYSTASNMADMLYLLPSVMGAILFPKLSALKKPEAKWAMAQKATWITAGLMTALGLAAALVAKPFIVLMFGEAFLPAVPPFWILCVSMVFYGANNMVSNFFSSVGLPWFSVYVWVFISVLNVVLNLFTIPAYGIMGAAFTSLVCYGLVLFLQCLYIGLKGVRLAGNS